MLPSSANVVRPGSAHATVVESPWRDGTGVGSGVISDDPVP
jgi:hypothetical protein